MNGRKSSAIGFIPILLIALIFGVYLDLSTNTTQNTTTTPIIASTTNDTLGVTLSIELNSSKIVSGQALNISVYVTNARSETNNLTFSSNWAEGWFLGWVAIDSCDSFANAQVFRGYYTLANISNIQPGSELQLAKLVGVPECPFMGGAWHTYFPFQPYESRLGYEYTAQGDYGYVNSSSNSNFRIFAPGNYTVAAGDEWGQLVLLHFLVAGSQSK